MAQRPRLSHALPVLTEHKSTLPYLLSLLPELQLKLPHSTQ